MTDELLPRARQYLALLRLDPTPWAQSAADEQEQLIAEIERLRKALQAIVKNQNLVGGGMASMSATRRIAAEALKPSPQGD